MWSGGRQDVLRMHGTGIGSVHSVQKKQRGESRNQNQSRLTPKGRRRLRMRDRCRPNIDGQKSKQRQKDTTGRTKHEDTIETDRKDTVEPKKKRHNQTGMRQPDRLDRIGTNRGKRTGQTDANRLKRHGRKANRQR